MNKSPNIISEPANPDNSSLPKQVRIWDLPTRVFHWALVFMVALAWISSEAEGSLLFIHVYSGTLLLGFVVFRLVWGIIGSRHALFTDFVFSWEIVRDYTIKLLTFRPPYSVGHNPLGGWMVVALLVVMTLAVLSGMMSSEDGYRGPLAHIGFGGDIHEGMANLFGFLIFVHIGGVVAHGLISGENLPRAMISGIKNIPARIGASDIRNVGVLRPAIAVAMAVVAVWLFWS
ncbi:MAG: cytochrome b/b6 domain-containing protein [Rhodospirillaceae bacterium]|nr:cytochrome b/b6 domain-containing protein [Rhodospirillaceae bacterium]